jgi:FkbM family methyltransferase
MSNPLSNRINRIWNKLVATKWMFKGVGKTSFSQVGEDRIIAYFFGSIGLKTLSYLEIGTNHPVLGNNTYSFYLTGSRGVLVEPDPSLHAIIKSNRPDDILLTSGIALTETKEADFYIFPSNYSGWNTFSADEVNVRSKMGIAIEKKITVPLKNVNDVIQSNCKQTPDFISIDVEGLDEEIIRSLDFEKNGPKLLCVETIRNGESAFVEKQHSLIEFICSKGYVVYADTFVNTIFVKKELLNK